MGAGCDRNHNNNQREGSVKLQRAAHPSKTHQIQEAGADGGPRRKALLVWTPSEGPQTFRISAFQRVHHLPASGTEPDLHQEQGPEGSRPRPPHEEGRRDGGVSV